MVFFNILIVITRERNVLYYNSYLFLKPFMSNLILVHLGLHLQLPFYYHLIKLKYNFIPVNMLYPQFDRVSRFCALTKPLTYYKSSRLFNYYPYSV